MTIIGSRLHLMAAVALSAADMGSAAAAAAGVATIRIISRAHDGFRRGGIAHSSDETYPLSRFTDGQLKLIQDEPMLTTIISHPLPSGDVVAEIHTPTPNPPTVPDGVLDPPLADGVAASPEKPLPPGTERLAALLELVPSFAIGDFTQAGLLRAEARRRIATQIGFEPTDEEVREVGEAYVKQRRD
ncbi:HI1506-related protein [Bosea sp. TND4EK4]|uniref:HI1506-related protein n=1 Tax=Bosea sp. TND4EK4 TaxID=1907408 RepID=UPI0009554595|nr:HI1506-related protein [Bosea sp. TND4EK4]SIP96089.1 hypothetical protein SAMN05880592_101339 [Bosea sp. TND4EK4]